MSTGLTFFQQDAILSGLNNRKLLLFHEDDRNHRVKSIRRREIIEKKLLVFSIIVSDLAELI